MAYSALICFYAFADNFRLTSASCGRGQEEEIDPEQWTDASASEFRLSLPLREADLADSIAFGDRLSELEVEGREHARDVAIAIHRDIA